MVKNALESECLGLYCSYSIAGMGAGGWGGGDLGKEEVVFLTLSEHGLYCSYSSYIWF